MEKVITHKGETWELKTRIAHQTFDHYDFTGTNFNSSIFEQVEFIGCLFDRSLLAGTKVFGETRVKDCVFKDVDLSNSTLGSNKGLYQNCLFSKCNFKGKEFNFTRFVNCVFDKCKLKKINFNASSFLECSFVGPMDDITFNGMYDTNKSGLPTIDKVNFSKAKFGEFVTFVECDLSTSISPAESKFEDILYQLYSNDEKILSTGSKDRIILTRK